MSQPTLRSIFKPNAIAIIGASNRTQSAGYLVIKNLLANNFHGPVMPVTPNATAVHGILAYPNITDLPIIPDLAIVCTRGSRVFQLIETLAQIGCKAAIIMASDIGHESYDHSGKPSDNEDNGDNTNQTNASIADIVNVAKRYNMRILGPNSLGIILPYLGLNASVAHAQANKGNIAFVSQSSAIGTTVLDWANHKNIGFSAFISLGDTCDIDVGELLDYLARDSATHAVMLYIDSVKNKQRFISAARACAKHKPILVIKSGRSVEGAAAARRHTGGPIGYDIVYDAVFRRAGMLRVLDLPELFAAVESLIHPNRLRGERLAIISNGGGPAILALDSLILRGGKPAELSDECINQLNAILPANWSRHNPIDIGGDADAKRYINTLRVMLDLQLADAILLLHSPSALNQSTEIANAVVSLLASHPNSHKVSILTNWSGEDAAFQARKIFTKAGIPTYRTPEGAVGSLMHLVEFRRNQKLLQEVPQSIPENIPTRIQDARDIITAAQQAGKLNLETHDATGILAAYGIDTITTLAASDVDMACQHAQTIGFPVALKIQSPQIMYKSDVQGVMLNLNSSDEVRQAADAMQARVKAIDSNANIDGLLVQKMALTAGAQELRLAVITDPIFGPAICLGEGGSEWSPTRDATVALPPLNMALARYMVIQALKTNKLRDRHLPLGLDRQALCVLLTKISLLIIDCPQIESLDLNPVLAAGKQITALDVLIKLYPQANTPIEPLAIQPYPKELEQWHTLKNGRRVMLRPILPEDEPKHLIFDNSLSAEDRYKRYFGVRAAMTHEEMAVFTQIDYAREMAFIAIDTDEHGEEITLGAVRASIDPDNTDAEFAMAVRSDYQGLGIGRLLLEKLIVFFTNKQTKSISGYTMIENRNMANLAKSLGFSVTFDLEDRLIHMHKPLSD
ncbi:bifunctional acetate--CoA ligase family protein/GNAT family N-acetyltransferase [Shewanella sp. SNU WT4]|uniref:bifunctional acetate--CoA ligase family protein/GNAT family N-acetyltransferase n=1 Tax=Shewanella sp. SNU WT4 TaxID=2590015 RepID=UPI00112C7788|nr:bifunctional acetate--CoA ligase family protein/GNAT family N-acetyltransferase [Shewanella sp. SNU WT4]QDF67016.1 bifunctional acetate--CoA ligase family protein/GNAT family N-acetyltransferase [Shewanella sp. SNU WT4]